MLNSKFEILRMGTENIFLDRYSKFLTKVSQVDRVGIEHMGLPNSQFVLRF